MPDLFIGLPISRDAASAFEKALGGLHAGEPVLKTNMTVELADLGNQPDDMIPKLVQHLEGLDVGPFAVETEGLDTAGGNAPTALFAVVKPSAGLKALHKMIGRAVREAGVPLTHTRFVPGVTLATFEAMGQHDLKQIMSFLSRRSALSTGPFLATDFMLCERRIENAVKVNKELGTFALMGRQL